MSPTNPYDFCPWKFWKEATAEQHAEQLAFQDSLLKSGTVKFGTQVFVSPLAGFVPTQVTIGDSSYIAGYAYVTDKVSIGTRSTVNPYAVVRGEVQLGDGVRIGSHACILGFNHNADDPTRPIYTQGTSAKGITIGDDVWIGSHAVILDGVKVGSHSIIAAGAIVVKEVPEYSVVAGNPARILRDRRNPKPTKKSPTQLPEALRHFSQRITSQIPEVLKRCESETKGLRIYVNSPEVAARNVSHSIRGLADAIEIAAAFNIALPNVSKADLITQLQSYQDPVSGMPFDPLQPDHEKHRLAPMTDSNTVYMVLSIGYALECLGGHFLKPLQAVHQLDVKTLRNLLEQLPWSTNAWRCGAWSDSLGTALWINRHHFNLEGPIAPLFEWLAESCKPHTGLWGDSTASQGWLQPVNGYYRLTRGTYAQFALPVPHPDSAIDTILAHIRLNRGFETDQITACNVLDTVHPLWLLLKQSSHRRTEALAFIERQASLILTRWVDGQGFSFSPSESPGLQGTEMWLSVLYIAADALGMTSELSYSPKGVHRLRAPEKAP